MDHMDLDEEKLAAAEERLDLIRGLEAKYGGSVKEVLKKLEEKRLRLDELEHFEQIRLKAEENLKEVQNKLDETCAELSQVRRKASGEMAFQIKKALEDLNFLDVVFEMEIERLDHFTPAGYDEARFLISTNPGEPAKPLGQVASGGELSRIMLAIKTVLADTDDIPTLIFDEIDTGISGRTAQKVSEKLAYIARTHQVICITHLPQIAAMADVHFLIEKRAWEGRTATAIRRPGGRGSRGAGPTFGRG